MKRILYLIFVFIIFGTSTSTAQLFQNYGISLKTNIASQDIFEGKNQAVSFRTENIVTYGIGAYFETPIFSFLNFRSQISFLQKKANDEKQFVSPFSSIVPILDPILNYLSVDLAIKAHLNKTKYNPFLILGVRQDMLLEKRPELGPTQSFIGSTPRGGIMSISENGVPLNEDFTIGTVVAVGLEINQLINCSIGINKDLSFASNREFTSSKNHLVTINAEINLSKVFHK